MASLYMHRRKFNEFWHLDTEGRIHIHDDAPEEVKRCYERYLEPVEVVVKRGTL